MIVFEMRREARGQIALEFITVYSVVLVIFVIIFAVITGQRASVLNAQQSSIAGIEAQEIAGYINHATSVGSGYTTTLSLAQAPGGVPYNVYVSTGGIIIVNTTAGGEQISAYAFSDGRNMSINGSQVANAVGIYEVPTYTGTLTVSNVGGTVYIDRAPVSNAGILGGSILGGVQEGYVPLFGAGNSMINVPDSPAIDTSNTFTLSMWFNTNSIYPQMPLIQHANGCNTNGFYIAYQSPYGGSMGIISYSGGANPGDWYPFPVFQNHTWYNIVFIWQSTGASSSTQTAYVDGVQANTRTVGIPVPAQIGQPLRIGNTYLSCWNTYYYNGLISDVQIYNYSLTANQINATYWAGPLAAPVAQKGLAGWWPLNGNANDYSGNGQNGQYLNVTFLSIAQLDQGIFAKNGIGLSNVPMGVVISNGTAGGSPFATYGRSLDGTFNAILTYNTINPNATVYSYDGNLSVSGNLIGWWPLSFGDLGGGIVYDLSGANDNGIYNNLVSWSPWSLSRHFAAALFPGNTVPGTITVNAIGSLSNITGRDNFTLVAWVKYNGPKAQPCQGIFGSGGFTGNGIQLMAKGNGDGCGIFYAGGNSLVGNYLIPFNSLNWTMLSVTWNGIGSVGTAYVFENTTVTASGPLNLGIHSITPTNAMYYIGAENSIGGGNFNGLVSDAQLYSQALSSAQIGQLYSDGPTGIPLTGTGLVGWWPLNANANDYSGGNNGAFSGGNTVFGSANYTFSYNTTAASRVATFNGMAGIQLLGGGTGFPYQGQFSVSLWFSSYNSSTAPFDSELFDAQKNSANYAYDVQLCGGGDCPGGITGIHGNIGSGSSPILSNSVNYQFQFAQRTPYSLIETFSTTGWTMYLDGANVSSGNYVVSSATPDLNSNANKVMVGGYAVGGSYFTGQIADVQIYNAVLTPAEARQIYQQGISPQSSVTLSMG